MTRRFKLLLSLAVLVPILVVGVWEAMYPDSGDPKNIHYVLWKWHLARIDLDRALGVMVHDNANSLVIGKSEEQLRERFGYLGTPDETGEYLRDYCYSLPNWRGKKVRFLRDSVWMVVFNGDVATDLVLCKG